MSGDRTGASRGERGAWAEDLALRFLARHGLACLARNHRCRHGEVDLVMRQGAELVFVEVRYRARAEFGDGADSVDRRKQGRLCAAARDYLLRAPGELTDLGCRFDVVAIAPGPRVDWVRDAFECPD